VITAAQAYLVGDQPPRLVSAWIAALESLQLDDTQLDVFLYVATLEPPADSLLAAGLANALLWALAQSRESTLCSGQREAELRTAEVQAPSFWPVSFQGWATRACRLRASRACWRFRLTCCCAPSRTEARS